MDPCEKMFETECNTFSVSLETSQRTKKENIQTVCLLNQQCYNVDFIIHVMQHIMEVYILNFYIQLIPRRSCLVSIRWVE